MQEKISAIVQAKQHIPGALLPILHDIQDALGYIPTQAVGTVALALNLSRAEVHGVITFYHHFRTEPVGSCVVQICRAEACQAMGAQALWEHACTQTQADSTTTLLPVYCLGLCAQSPAIAINDTLHAKVDSAKLDRLLAAATAKGQAA
jgi:formate dehydrogenase subunit gamma